MHRLLDGSHIPTLPSPHTKSHRDRRVSLCAETTLRQVQTESLHVHTAAHILTVYTRRGAHSMAHRGRIAGALHPLRRAWALGDFTVQARRHPWRQRVTRPWVSRRRAPRGPPVGPSPPGGIPGSWILSHTGKTQHWATPPDRRGMVRSMKSCASQISPEYCLPRRWVFGAREAPH